MHGRKWWNSAADLDYAFEWNRKVRGLWEENKKEKRECEIVTQNTFKAIYWGTSWPGESDTARSRLNSFFKKCPSVRVEKWICRGRILYAWVIVKEQAFIFDRPELQVQDRRVSASTNFSKQDNGKSAWFEFRRRGVGVFGLDYSSAAAISCGYPRR